MNIKLTIGILVLTVVGFSSCKKEEGEGGTSSISGKVYGKNYNKGYTTVVSKGYRPKADVYIIYGNDVTFGDKQETNHDGSYQFKYLRKGSYKIFAYSKDTTGKSAFDIAVTVTGEITEDDQAITVPDITVADN